MQLPYETSNDLIGPLHKKLRLTQWAFLGFVLLLSIFTSFQKTGTNLLLLPFAGFLGYFFLRSILPIPILTTLITFLTTFLAGSSLFGSGLSSAIICSVLYFLLTLLGSGMSFMLVHYTTGFKEQSKLRKVRSLFIWLVVLFLSSSLFSLYDQMNGNPIMALYAKAQMEKYLQATYPGVKTIVHDPDYGFTDHDYHADAFLYNDKGAHRFNISYRKGSIWDDYFTRYEEDIATSNRLAKEATKELTDLLQAHSIDFNGVECYFSRIPKGKYDTTPFDRTTFTGLYSVAVYQLTDEKASYEAFSQWCESVRRLLVDAGYTMEALSMDSDPHFMSNRLSLQLSAEELLEPIVDASLFKRFSDYGVMNGYTNLSKEEFLQRMAADDKFELSYNPLLSEALAEALQETELLLKDDVRVKTSEEVAEITVIGYGKRISIDRFVENIINLRDFIVAHPELLANHRLESMSFSYYWGTSYEAYNYNLYADQLQNLSSEEMLEALLNDEKLKAQLSSY